MTAEIAEIKVELSRIGREIRAGQQFRVALFAAQVSGLVLLFALAWKAGEWLGGVPWK